MLCSFLDFGIKARNLAVAPLESHSVPAFRIGSSEQLDEGDGAAAHLQLIFGPWQIEMPIIRLLFSEADSS